MSRPNSRGQVLPEGLRGCRSPMGSPAFGLELKPDHETRIEAELAKSGKVPKAPVAGAEDADLSESAASLALSPPSGAPESSLDWYDGNAGSFRGSQQQSSRSLHRLPGAAGSSPPRGRHPSNLRAASETVLFATRGKGKSPSKGQQQQQGGGESDGASASGDGTGVARGAPPALVPGQSSHMIFKKNICGDLFGNNANEEGMLYASRNMKVGGAVGETHKGKLTAAALEQKEKDALAAADSKNGKSSIFHHDGGYWTDTSDSGESEKDEGPAVRGGSVTTKTEKQRLALTLNNWCLEEGNTEYMLEEGGVETLIALSKLDDRLIKRECAQAFNRLCRLPSNRPRLLSAGLHSTLINLAYALKSPRRGHDCAQALVALTLVPGAEEALVLEGAVSAFMALMSLGESTVAPVCVQGLFNLTCATAFYPSIEKVIKAIVNLPFTDRIDPRPLIMKGILNCTLPFQVRLKPRLIEEGVVQLLEAYIPRIETDEGRTICARILYNLSTSRAVRTDMVLKGAVRSLSYLTRFPTGECAFFASKTLAKVTMDRSSRMRMIDDGIVQALEVLVKRNDISFKLQQCHAAAAQAISNISAFTDIVPYLVKLGGINLLISLCASKNAEAKHFCGAAFCNFLKDSSCHEVIINAGALKPLIDLSLDDQMKGDVGLISALAYALYNISQSSNAIEAALDAGLIKCLKNFSRQDSDVVRELVAASICNLALSGHKKNGRSIVQSLIDDDVLDCLKGMMDTREEVEKMPQVTQQCVTAFAILSQDEASHEEITKQGCVSVLVGLGLYSNDTETKTVCASVLSSLTFGPISRVRLIEEDGLKAVIRLSLEKGTVTRQMCAVALCNISADQKGALRMLQKDRGIVDVLAKLSNTYSEEAQQDCAKCLCNLSCQKDFVQYLVETKAVHAIMMIAMVRSVDPKTKEFCAKALLNLMAPNTMDAILNQGVLQTFGTFCLQEEEEMMAICAQMFCVTSGTRSGRDHMTQRLSCLRGLNSLIRSKCRETQLNCTRAVINLLFFEDSKIQATKAGCLLVIRVLTTLGDYSQDVAKLAASGASEAVVEARHQELRSIKLSCERDAANAVARLAKDEVSHPFLVKENIPSVLVLLAQSMDPATVRYSVRALGCCSFHKNLRKPLIDAGCVSTIVWLVLSGQYLAEIGQDAARCLCYLSISADGRAQMVAEHAVSAIIVLAKRCPRNSPVAAICALTLQYFSWSKVSQVRVVEDGAAKLLVVLSKIACAIVPQSVHGGPTAAWDKEVARNCSVAFANLSNQVELRESLLGEGIIEGIRGVVGDGRLRFTDSDYVWRVCSTMFHMSLDPKIRYKMTAQGAVFVIVSMSKAANDASKQLCAAAICNISKSKSSRKKAVEDGAVECLIDIAQNPNILTAQYCAEALSNLSAFAKVEGGTVKALLEMSSTVEKTERLRNLQLGIAVVTPNDEGEEDEIEGEGGNEEEKTIDDGGPVPAQMKDPAVEKAERQTRLTMVANAKTAKLKNFVATGLIAKKAPSKGIVSKEQLLGLPPPIESNIGSEEEHDKYCKSMEEADGPTKAHTCHYGKYHAGMAYIKLPPPGSNPVDFLLEAVQLADDAGKNEEDFNRAHGDSKAAQKKRDPETESKLFEKMKGPDMLKPARTPAEERALSEAEAVEHREAEMHRREQEEEERAGDNSGRNARQAREGFRKRRNSWKQDAQSRRESYSDVPRVSNNNSPVMDSIIAGIESVSVDSDAMTPSEKRLSPVEGERKSEKKQGTGAGGTVTALDKLDANMKKQRSHPSLSRKATEESMKGHLRAEQPKNRKERAASPPTLPAPEKKLPTPSKPIFANFDDPANRQLLEEAMQFANEARLLERKSSKRQ